MVAANKMKNQKVKVSPQQKKQKKIKKPSLRILDAIKELEKTTNITSKGNTEKENKPKEKKAFENLGDLLKKVAKPELTSKKEKLSKKKKEVNGEKIEEQSVKSKLASKKINKPATDDKTTVKKQLTDKKITKPISDSKEITKKIEKKKRKVPESEKVPEPAEIPTKKQLNDPATKKVKSQKLKNKKEAEVSSKVTEETIVSKNGIKKEKKTKAKVLKNKNKIGNLELTQSSVEKAVDVVFQLAEKEKQEKKSLLPFENNPIFLQVNCIRIPKVSRRRIRIPLPHVMIGSNDEVALFVTDLQRGRRQDYEKTVEYWETILKEKEVTKINTIIPINQVKTEYNQYEMQRKLARLYDFFLVDARITGHLCHLLGKAFTRFATPPVPVKLTQENLKQEIKKALKKTTLEIHAYGPSHTAQIATLSMPRKKVIINVIGFCEKLKEKYPGGFDNIRSILIKTKNSLAIPVYYSIKNRNEVPIPIVKPKRPKAFTVVEGELSTLDDDVKVKLTPSGRVTIIKNEEPDKTEEIKNEPEMEEKELKSEVKKTKKKNKVTEKKVVGDEGKIVKQKKKIKMEKQ